MAYSLLGGLGSGGGMTWLLIIGGLILLAVLIAGVVSAAKKTRTLPAAVAAALPAQLKVWTPSEWQGQKGRYYLAAYGVTRAEAEALISSADPAASKTPLGQVALEALNGGTMVFYFVPDGDKAPFTAARLNPIDGIEHVSSSDVFTLTDGKLTSPYFTNEIKCCTDATKCQEGMVLFGGNAGGASLELEQVGAGYRLFCQRESQMTYLNLGPTICPYNGTTSELLQKSCAKLGVGVAGGPRVAMMGPSAKELYYLEAA